MPIYRRRGKCMLQLQFKCIYCEQELSANEDDRGKSGKCPRCGHDFFVPGAIPAPPPIRVEKTETIQNAEETLTEINPVINKKCDSYKFDEVKVDTYKLIGPTYDKLSLFLMAFTLIILFITNTAMQGQVYKVTMLFFNHIADFDIANWSLFYNDNNLFDLFFVVASFAFFLGGFGLSIYNIYAKREKTKIEREMMLGFASITNYCTAIAVGFYMFKNTTGWLIIFPIWNLINAGLMMYNASISDREASDPQLIIGILSVLLISTVCNFVFQLYWPITFSICLVYTTSLDRALQSIFPVLAGKKDEQTEV